MSASNYYETQRGISEYLLFHYGSQNAILGENSGPIEALNFPVRAVSECLELRALPTYARALDLGCAVGRSTFELARHCTESIGIDRSAHLIAAAQEIQSRGVLKYSFADEGDLRTEATAVAPSGIDCARAHFEQGDALNLRPGLGLFDVILMANLIDRLPDPRKCLESIPQFLKSRGQLILTSPYTWLEEYTPKNNWLGGFERDGRQCRTSDALRDLLDPFCEFQKAINLPFLIREHARKFQWGIAEATIWIKK